MKGTSKQKVPYVAECELFVRADYKHAEELLAEYNDFYLYNMAQLAQIHHTVDPRDEADVVEEIDEAKRLEIADKNAKAATEHFTSLFGGKDFSESAIAGLKFSWYDLQKILIGEYKQKTPIYDSAMNGIAQMLRNTASIMLFGLYVTEGLDDLNGTDEQIGAVKDGIRDLFERNVTEKLDIPEYNATKKQFKKFKKPEQYMEFCDKLFAQKGA